MTKIDKLTRDFASGMSRGTISDEEWEAEFLPMIRDAERYRWLRDSRADTYGDEYGFTFVYEMKFDDFDAPSRGLDSAIDNARNNKEMK